jgi:hypothetical protein
MRDAGIEPAAQETTSKANCVLGTQYTGSDWNQILETDKGDAIAQVMAPFHEEPPHLAPPAANLLPTIAAALREIGVYPDQVAVVLVSAVEAAVRALEENFPMSVSGRLEEDVAEILKRTLRCDLWFELRASRLFAQVPASLGLRTWEYLEEAVWGSLSDCNLRVQKNKLS